ncbi:MAG: PIN domain-containing protein [Myxococcales bacterium]|nr:PIN domain-containing protein [Myxococcales bacterium]MCB9707377.1 PIN domain-containing protein [Myxococcales bacterium]
MVLLDTSVWLLTFRKHRPLKLETVLPLDEVVTCLPIIQEVLQGFRDERAFRIAHTAMNALPAVETPLPRDVFEVAVSLYRDARRSGITIRSSVDCLIAACALRNGLTVLHRDRDFDALSRVSALRAQSV